MTGSSRKKSRPLRSDICVGMVERHSAVIMVAEREAQSYDGRQKEIGQRVSRHGVFDLPNPCIETCCCPPARQEVKQADCQKRDKCQRNKFRLEWPLYWKPNVVSWKEQEKQTDSDWGMEKRVASESAPKWLVSRSGHKPRSQHP